jgi:hypothetical protein
MALTEAARTLKKIKARRGQAEKQGRDHRRVERIGIDELNQRGADLLVNRAEELGNFDSRPMWQRALDVIDLPRNVVANVIADVAGIDTSEMDRASLGLKRVNFSDILGHMGVDNKVVKGVVGFVGDALVDPLTYATLGATTGLKIGAGAPKMLKSGQKGLKAAATAASAGRKVAPDIVQGLATRPGALQRLARMKSGQLLRSGRATSPQMAQKATQKWLMSKRGGQLTRLLARRANPASATTGKALRNTKAARAFLSKFGEKGRTVARLPFATTGLTWKGGKAGALAKEFAEGVPDDASRILKAARGSRKASVKQSRIQEIVQRMKQSEAGQATKAKSVVQNMVNQGYMMSPGTRKQLEGLVRSRGAGTKARSALVKKRLKNLAGAQSSAKQAGRLASQEGFAAATSPMAALSTRQALAEQIGKQRGATQSVRDQLSRVKERLFGPGASSMSRVEAGAQSMMGSGRARAATLARQEFLKRAQPVIADIAASTGRSADEVMSALYDLAEVGGDISIATARFSPMDPIHASLSDFAGQIAQRDDVQDLMKYIRSNIKADYNVMKRANLAPARQIDYIPRPMTDDAARAIREQELRGLKNPFEQQRVRMLEFRQVDPNGIPVGPSRYVKSSDTADIAKLRQAGMAQTNEFHISASQWNQWSQTEGTGLLPASFRGPMFRRDLGDAMAQSAGARIAREGMAELRDIAQKWSVPMTAQELVDPQRLSVQHLAKAIPDDPVLKRSPFMQIVGPQLEGRAVPQQIARMLERASAISLQPQELKQILDLSDKTLGIWKGYTLMHPSYTLRNIVQNYLGGAMAGANPRAVFRRVHSKDLARIVRQIDQGGPITGTIELAGQMVPAQQVANKARQLNMVNAGLISEALSPGFKAKAKHFLAGEGTPVKKWFQLNNRIENRHRLATWMHFMDQGMDAEQAAMKTIQAMPDLSHLTLFERNFGRRVFPWYAWFRKNGALQLFHYLPNKPAFYAGMPKLGHALEMSLVGEDGVPDELRPSWMQENQGVQILGDSDKGTVFLMGSWLPFEELTKAFAAMQSPSEGATSIMERMRPGLKFMAETATGHDIFRRRPVEELTTKDLATTLAVPKALAGRSGTPLDNVLTVRPIREISRVMDMPSYEDMAIRGVLAGALQPVNRERGRRAVINELRDKQRMLRGKINRARQVSDPREEQALLKQWLQVTLELQRLGDERLAKSTQKMLSEVGRGN